jgi:hypothetical protein
MDLGKLASPGAIRMKAFPPGRRGVLIPLRDRRTAALGICLYTASKPAVIAGQVAAHWVTQTVGGWALPGRVESWQPPCEADEWRKLVQQWEDRLGPLDGVAAYRRRQQARSGLTLVVTRSGTPVAVVKMRDDAFSLDLEQRALAAVHVASPSSFRAPRPLGTGDVAGWHWAAQEAVFDRPHRPVLRAPRGLFDQVADVLTTVAPAGSGDGVPSHGDLTPWNLRRDSAGQIWLYDWEDCGMAPREADRAYFTATAAALGAGSMPSGLPAAAIAHCREVLQIRNVANPEGVELTCRMIAALDQAERLSANPGRIRGT